MLVVRPNAESAIGYLAELDTNAKTAVFITSYPIWLAAGMTLPYVDGYWDASLVEMVLDERLAWKRIVFEAQDAAMSRYEGGRVLRKASEMPTRGSVPEQFVAGGWDHEHWEASPGTHRPRAGRIRRR